MYLTRNSSIVWVMNSMMEVMVGVPPSVTLHTGNSLDPSVTLHTNLIGWMIGVKLPHIIGNQNHRPQI